MRCFRAPLFVCFFYLPADHADGGCAAAHVHHRRIGEGSHRAEAADKQGVVKLRHTRSIHTVSKEARDDSQVSGPPSHGVGSGDEFTCYVMDCEDEEFTENPSSFTRAMGIVCVVFACVCILVAVIVMCFAKRRGCVFEIPDLW